MTRQTIRNGTVVSVNIISRKTIWYSGYVGDFKYYTQPEV